MSRRGRFLVVCTDRSGAMQAWRLDWHTGESHQFTAAAALDPASVALTGDDRSLFYCDGPSVRQAALGSQREHEVARAETGWERAPGFAVSLDGSLAVWVEQQTGRFRLRSVRMPRGAVETILETDTLISDPQLRPRSTQLFFRVGGESRIIDTATHLAQKITLNGQALWSPVGTLLYLSVPADRGQLTTLREYLPDDKTDRLVAKTSQFASFGINSDSSVFAGASRSLASPYLLLLLRSARRELTLCEHRCSDARLVNPVFSSDSQSVFFVSDRNGKPAVFRSHVERFVEETDTEG